MTDRTEDVYVIINKLPSDCPRKSMTHDEMDAVQTGTLDYVGDRWVRK